jgi:hypothetical protein
MKAKRAAPTAAAAPKRETLSVPAKTKSSEELGEKQKRWVEARDELSRGQAKNRRAGSHCCPANPSAEPVEFCELKLIEDYRDSPFIEKKRSYDDSIYKDYKYSRHCRDDEDGVEPMFAWDLRDEAYRFIVQCEKCNEVFLVQVNTYDNDDLFHMHQTEVFDIIPASSIEDAKRLNDEYNGEQLYSKSRANGYYRNSSGGGIDFSKLPIPPEDKIVEI